jgi:hypothetical protein
MTSEYLDLYQPPRSIPQVEYELSHHQNCGQDQVLVTSVGTFATLQDAQDSAQHLLQTTLNQYMSRGWCGFYCNDIDLEFRGLISGLLSQDDYTYLSEIQIHAREKAHQVIQPHFDGVEAWVSATGNEPVDKNLGSNNPHSIYVALAPTETLIPWRPGSTSMQPQQESSACGRRSRGTDSFSRTRPEYPSRPNFFIPRTSTQYDETMSLFAARGHSSSVDQDVDTGHARPQSGTHHHGKQSSAWN